MRQEIRCKKSIPLITFGKLPGEVYRTIHYETDLGRRVVEPNQMHFRNGKSSMYRGGCAQRPA
jgi:hypothetical protein